MHPWLRSVSVGSFASEASSTRASGVSGSVSANYYSPGHLEGQRKSGRLGLWWVFTVEGGGFMCVLGFSLFFSSCFWPRWWVCRWDFRCFWWVEWGELNMLGGSWFMMDWTVVWKSKDPPALGGICFIHVARRPVARIHYSNGLPIHCQ